MERTGEKRRGDERRGGKRRGSNTEERGERLSCVQELGGGDGVGCGDVGEGLLERVEEGSSGWVSDCCHDC